MTYTQARKAIDILMDEWQAAGRDTVTLLAAMDEAVRDVRRASGVEVEQWAAAMRSEREAAFKTGGQFGIEPGYVVMGIELLSGLTTLEANP